MSLVVLATAQARAGDSVTQEMIDGVEEWLVGEIGPLTGDRTETFYLSERRDLATVDGLWLSRRTDLLTSLTNDGTALTLDTDYRLINGILILQVSTGASWGDTMVATYTPNDTDQVTEAIYDLLTLRMLQPNLQAVRIGAYSETYFPSGGFTGGQASALRQILTRIKPATRLGRYASPFRYRAYREDRTLVENIGS